MGRRPNLTLAILLASTIALPVSVSSGQAGTAADRVAALRPGGCVLVMRHASSPRTAPTRELANPDDTSLERQLDATGRDGATAMGQALRALKVPIGDVLTSPT
jgi:hypothetical protein